MSNETKEAVPFAAELRSVVATISRYVEQSVAAGVNSADLDEHRAYAVNLTAHADAITALDKAVQGCGKRHRGSGPQYVCCDADRCAQCCDARDDAISALLGRE